MLCSSDRTEQALYCHGKKKAVGRVDVSGHVIRCYNLQFSEKLNSQYYKLHK